MKFSDLKIGETFQLDSESYRKTGPLLASKLEGGGQKPMRRSQAVTLIDAPSTGSPSEEKALPLKSSLDAYHTKLEALLAETLNDEQLNSLRKPLHILRQQLHRNLDLD